MSELPAAIDPELVSALAPRGPLRAAINFGNPVLANRDPATGEPVGVSIDLATEFARWLGTGLELIVFEAAAESVDAVRNDRADIGFFAIDPARGDGLLFTAPYVLIEGSYLVPDGSSLVDNAQVDVASARVSVGSGSAYDLFLTRELERAQIVRLDGAAAVLAALRSGAVDVAAGIRPALETEAAREPGVRLLPGRFMVIQQAMGLPAGRGIPAHSLLVSFVEEMKVIGFVAASLERHHISGGVPAPASAP